eukprot:1156472-Pelagomonas_calceolata.AAC.2
MGLPLPVAAEPLQRHIYSYPQHPTYTTSVFTDLHVRGSIFAAHAAAHSSTAGAPGALHGHAGQHPNRHCAHTRSCCKDREGLSRGGKEDTLTLLIEGHTIGVRGTTGRRFEAIQGRSWHWVDPGASVSQLNASGQVTASNLAGWRALERPQQL